MDQAGEGREAFLRALIYATALETYEAILCIDLETMDCTVLRPGEGSFVPSKEQLRWGDNTSLRKRILFAYLIGGLGFACSIVTLILAILNVI